MTYKETIQQIYDLQEFAIKLGLENICALANRLGNPHLKYPVIHIAGTNGKGSTAFSSTSYCNITDLKAACLPALI